MASHHMEEYLEAIGRLEERGEPVSTSALARERGVSPPAVTDMVRRLTDLGLVTHESRGKVRLTEDGRRQATTVMRRHRLWERFLHDILQLGWDEVHDEACKLEHATSPEVERRLAQALGNSDTCPHGNVIPSLDGEVGLDPVATLSELRPMQVARVVSLRNEDSGLLRRMEKLGIKPGTIVRISETPTDNGGIGLWVGSSHHVLERDVASQITAEAVDPEEADRPDDLILPLCSLLPKEAGMVRHIAGGRSFLARCLALGFTPGVEVKMLQNFGAGSIIVLVRDTRVALGQGEARKIQISRKPVSTNGP